MCKCICLYKNTCTFSQFSDWYCMKDILFWFFFFSFFCHDLYIGVFLEFNTFLYIALRHISWPNLLDSFVMPMLLYVICCLNTYINCSEVLILSCSLFNNIWSWISVQESLVLVKLSGWLWYNIFRWLWPLPPLRPTSVKNFLKGFCRSAGPVGDIAILSV